VAERFLTDFKRFFFYGLAAVLPTLLTLAILVYVITFLDKYLAAPVTSAVRWVVMAILSPTGKVPAFVENPQQWMQNFWWVGFVLSLVGIYIFGRIMASLLGRSIWQMVERVFFRLPLVKQIYPNIKQVTEFLFSKKRMEFSRVVAVEYPRKGAWSLGLVTGAGLKSLGQALHEDLLTVFIPSTPTPVAGYVITVRREEVLDLPLSIDDAMRFLISGGVIVPASQLPSDAETNAARQGKPWPVPRKEIVT
jgi:uncharacterized membrane protein